MLLRGRSLGHLRIAGRLNQVSGMTGLACDSIEMVLGPVKLRLILPCDMTRQTSPGIFRGLPAESEDQFLRGLDFRIVVSRIGHRFRMSFAGAMT